MKKRIISFAASLSLIGSVIAPINALADEETTASFTGDGYTVTYEVKSGWGHNQNVEVTLTNTGDEPILNWALEYDAKGEINGIWNGVIFDSNESSYVIKNSGYNYEILPEDSVTFGYTLTGDELDIPESITLCSQREDVDAESYSVSLSVSDDLGSGFNGLITIENLSDRPIEAWRLGFDANFEISNVWNAQLLSSDNNSYSVCSDITTTPIGVGETKTFGFAAVKDQDSIPEITNSSLSEVAINADLTDHNDDSSEIDDSSSEYSDDSSSENDDSSETDSSDVSSESDSSDESSEYEEPVVRPQTYTYEVRNEDCAVDEITVSMETAGDLEGTTTIESIMDKDVMCSGVVGLFGEPFDINTSSEFSSAVLTFKVDKSMLGDTEFDNLLFLWYDEENENFVELDTEHDEENSTVSTTVTHFSKYMVVDGLAWYTNWQNIARTMQGFLYPSATILIETCTDENDPSSGEIWFTIEGKNGTSTYHSPKTYREQIKHHLLSLMHDYDLLQLTCAAYLHVIDPVDNYYDTFSMFMTSDKNYLKSGSFYSDTDFTNIGYALSNCSSDFSGYPEYLKRIIIVTDRDLTCDPYEIASSGYGAISTDIPVYFICIGEFETIGLQNIINHCGGAIYSISSESEFITFLQTWDMLKMRAEQDTDGDGLLDYFEINGIPLANGQLLTGCDYEKKHSDWDGLADNEEIIPRLQYSPITLTFDGEPFITEGYYFKMNSDPTLEDTDGDGYWDDVEINEYHSDPKTKDVIKHQLKQPFISIEGSYGGDQGWYNTSDELSTDYIISKYGCGLISISDVILYVSNSMGIQSPAGNFINTDELNNIPKEEYMNYIRYMDEFYFDLIRGVGLNGISMEWDFNFLCWSNNIELTADWNTDALLTQDIILEMLDNDIPVTLAIGPDDEFGVDFYNDLCFTTNDSYYLENKGKEFVEDHYVTVTGAIENRIKDNVILEISSWGEKYYIDFDEYEVFVAQHSNYIFSNVLYIYPD